MANIKNSLRVSLPDHTVASLDREAIIAAFLEEAQETAENYLSSLALSEDDVVAISGGIDRFLSDKPGMKSCNMTALTGIVAFKYLGATDADMQGKIATYVRSEQDRFYVGRGRLANHAGGVVLLDRVSPEEKAKLFAKREENAEKAEKRKAEKATKAA